MDRIDMAHEKYSLLLHKRRYLAPISDDPQQILDLGTGTGIWAMDMADTFPSAQVTGVDIAPIQPTLVPPNCQFEVDDIEQPWTHPENSFDFIFARDIILSIRDYPSLISEAYAHCKPGGYVEFQSIYGKLSCDDGSLPADSSFFEYDRHLRNAARAFGTPLEDPENFSRWFEEAGFEAVVEQRFKMPTNTWAKSKRMKMVGLFERENFLQNLEGMSLRVFQKGLGWTPQETSILLARVRNEIRKVRYHSYYGFWVVYGRKPMPSRA
ncbi:S-adenosyl-L-methionine-dependent methyltransferase [Teratosphaeria nubilosa]|uniref:S-adenosyl-L-methionine-dependent methyltransferase n=1 Tax=Teratosphaeria nubilosa TaxID=161662 RepID=A0A6G1KWF0_9PEZI|nr:S-adenosyl-L-methionine-dependent methyltransferase [Teratosphaeria nubilosa]